MTRRAPAAPIRWPDGQRAAAEADLLFRNSEIGDRQHLGHYGPNRPKSPEVILAGYLY
jgi:hypothetical protein